MTKSKNTKKALLASCLSMLLCVAMLIGTSFAWFTDSVTTGVNKIVAGNLEIKLNYWNENSESWENAENKPLFDYDKWEPGYMAVQGLQVKNAGSLALKWKAAINSTEELSILGDVIDVYVKSGADYTYEKPASREDVIANWTNAGTLKQFVAGIQTTTYGSLDAGDTADLGLALVMRTSAGNEYQGKDLGGDITLTILATQDTVENDSFNNQYDKDATYQVSTMTDLISAVGKGGNIVLQKDLTWASGTLTLTKDTVLDLNGNKLGPKNSSSALSINGANVTIKNGTVELPANAGYGTSILQVTGDADVIVENCTLKTDSQWPYAIATNGADSLNSSVTLKNTTLYTNQSYTAYFPAGNISMDNCDVTGAVIVTGGSLSINGGVFTAAGFPGQPKIWNAADTASYLNGMPSGSAGHMGDSILLIDRRAGYQPLSKVEIKNVTFNTELTLKDGTKATAYAIKYFDAEGKTDEARVNCVIEGNTYNHKMNGKDPLMFIDKSGNNISK